jgi:hypothetical protein
MSNEMRELTKDELNIVAGGDMAFSGMNCSLNENAAIGKIVGVLGTIPIVGGLLAAGAAALGRGFCG